MVDADSFMLQLTNFLNLWYKIREENMNKKYYEAYDDRYKQVHQSQNKPWAGDRPSPTIEKLLKKYGADSNSSILEIGCGEGQNAIYLMKRNYNLDASDVSLEAIRWCKEQAKIAGVDENRFFVMDILNNNLDKKYDFIFSVAVLHMLVEDKDRNEFFNFVRNHLNDTGKAIIVVMGDGKMTRKTDATKAFDLADRPFEDKIIQVATTSCRMVTWDQYLKEFQKANLKVINHYLDKTISGFEVCMVAVAEKGK